MNLPNIVSTCGKQFDCDILFSVIKLKQSFSFVSPNFDFRGEYGSNIFGMQSSVAYCNHSRRPDRRRRIRLSIRRVDYKEKTRCNHPVSCRQCNIVLCLLPARSRGCAAAAADVEWFVGDRCSIDSIFAHTSTGNRVRSNRRPNANSRNGTKRHLFTRSSDFWHLRYGCRRTGLV